MVEASKLPVDTDVTANEMAALMFGSGIEIQSAKYTGASEASGIYTQADTITPGFAPSDTGVILSTGNASSITNASGDANVTDGTSQDHARAGDDDLNDMSGQTTFDAAIFEAEFIPEGSVLTMQIVFSSEEYLEYVNSGFNDAVGIWVNGEPAKLTVGDGAVSIDNINNETNSNLYIDNPSSAETFNTEMDGFTVTLTLKAPVIPDQVNTIKIGIADGGDGSYDSNLMIAGNSVQTSLVAHDDTVAIGEDGTAQIDVLANDESHNNAELKITEINGIPVSVGDRVVLTSGEIIQLTENGLSIDASDGATGETSFSYMVQDDVGNSDTAFVEMSKAVPCFLRGTLVQTPFGKVPVESVRENDVLMTLDHGAQHVRWVGQRHISVQEAEITPKVRPISIKAGALGPGVPSQELLVSRQHRFLIRSVIAARMFGVSEVLVSAKDLLAIEGVDEVISNERISYHHILFDRHEILFANGAEAESIYLGAQTKVLFGKDKFSEMCLRIQRVDIASDGNTLRGARQMVQGKTARQMVARHIKNQKPLVEKASLLHTHAETSFVPAKATDRACAAPSR